jgi:hypothetical protein
MLLATGIRRRYPHLDGLSLPLGNLPWSSVFEDQSEFTRGHCVESENLCGGPTNELWLQRLPLDTHEMNHLSCFCGK